MGSEMCIRDRNRSGGNGFGHDDIGYAAPVVRRYVWRHGSLYHGGLAGSQFVDYRGVARDVLFDIQDKSGVILNFRFNDFRLNSSGLRPPPL